LNEACDRSILVVLDTAYVEASFFENPLDLTGSGLKESKHTNQKQSAKDRLFLSSLAGTMWDFSGAHSIHRIP
jgi:hypothetical protein